MGKARVVARGRVQTVRRSKIKGSPRVTGTTGAKPDRTTRGTSFFASPGNRRAANQWTGTGR